MATLAQLIARTADRLSMVAGTGVQVYAEDRITEMIQHKFDVLFDEVFWPQFLTWATWTLDGTLGVVTTDLTDLVKRFEDVRVVFPENSNTALTKVAALTTNVFTLSGTTPIHYEALGPAESNKTTRVFNVWPKGATGNINVQYRTRPDTFVTTDEIDFDDQALILGATFDYLEDDGTNPNATQKFQLLFEARVKQLKNSFNSAPISLDPVTALPQTFSFVELP
jgi:predicted nuclease of predicted toxin-antitoxin system